MTAWWRSLWIAPTDAYVWGSGDPAPACCRFCRTESTAGGVEGRGHREGSIECARMLDFQDAELEREGALFA